MDFRNSTSLDSEQLRRLVLRFTAPFRHDKLTVRVRYSRGADFSGTCYYRDARIFVNLGRHNRYPYAMGTHLAKARSNATHWWRETHLITVADAYQLALFVYLHELFHYLVKAAGRNPRRKEAMCDRFAAGALIDAFGCPVRDAMGRPVARESWDFQDLRRFVAAAPRHEALAGESLREIPVTIHGIHMPAAAATTSTDRPKRPQ
ncbi:MAG: hypothetical protein IH986_03580 [Planctomycetes bacterium]|nr:hypothetical protein [Planctomycetota bacterium]